MDVKGIGKSPKNTIAKVSNEAPSNDEVPEKVVTKQKVTIYSAPPAVATKSVRAEDLFNVCTCTVLCWSLCVLKFNGL